jgi:hypothetical protein
VDTIFEKKATLFLLNQMNNCLINQKDKLDFLQKQNSEEKQNSKEKQIIELQNKIKELENQNPELQEQIIELQNKIKEDVIKQLQEDNLQNKQNKQIQEDNLQKQKCLTGIKEILIEEIKKKKNFEDRKECAELEKKLKYTENLIIELNSKEIREKSIYNYDSEFKYSKSFYTEVETPIFKPPDVITDMISNKNKVFINPTENKKFINLIKKLKCKK